MTRRRITKYRILQSPTKNHKKLKRKLYLLTIGLVITTLHNIRRDLKFKSPLPQD